MMHHPDFDEDEDEDGNYRCAHRRIQRKYGGVCCLDCGEILQEPDDDE